MSVAGFVRASHGQSALIGPDVVRTEGAQPYGRHESAARKLALRDDGRVNFHGLLQPLYLVTFGTVHIRESRRTVLPFQCCGANAPFLMSTFP